MDLPSNDSRREMAELLREAFLASFQPDLIHITSLFEGFNNDAVTSIGKFDQTTPVSVTVFEWPETLDEVRYSFWRDHKLKMLSQAATWFAMTEVVPQEIQSDVRSNFISQTSIESACGWDELAGEVLTKWAMVVQTCTRNFSIKATADKRPRLAFVSPLLPERTGIADYSAELLPVLAKYYEIEVVVAQDQVTDPWVNQHATVRNVSWLRANACAVDRVLYQIGNSPFHQYMLPLLQEIPGAVVLHDFFIGHLIAGMEFRTGDPHVFTKAIYISHGYSAVLDRFRNVETAMFEYPANFSVLKYAKGLIVHSEYSRSLIQRWYGNDHASDCQVIPLLRSPAAATDKQMARKQLGVDERDFVVCSFGYLGATKLNHRLLQAWLQSALAGDKRCHLFFVGENDGGNYGVNLMQSIGSSGCGDRIRITGFASHEMFLRYLAAADLSVQLRTHSRGETSATVLDCMNYGLPLIVNANGSMAELDDETVWMLPDEFSDAVLVDALETLWQDPDQRQSLGTRASKIIPKYHGPEECARQYAIAIERFHLRTEKSAPTLISALVRQKTFDPDDAVLVRLSKTIANIFPSPRPAKRLFLDVSVTRQNDLKTGIQRVVRALVCELIASPPNGYRVEPIYLSDKGGIEWHYRTAGQWTVDTIGIATDWSLDDPIEYSAGDLMLVLDFTGDYFITGEKSGVFKQLKNNGVEIHVVVYDLLPILIPQVFPPGGFSYQEWINAVARIADGAMCISQAVSEELRLWSEISSLERSRPLNIGWFHLGADIQNSSPTLGIPENAESVFSLMAAHPCFLMVGTVEPRKAYLQTIEAFTRLWEDGFEISLVIVGNEGWKGLPNEMRCDIPKIVDRLRGHPELNKRLFWLEGISDEYLEKVYAASTCLIAASYGEGFGLPLIEAAQHKLPIIARDIPVFREVAGDFSFYFEGTNPDDLASAVRDWLLLYAVNQHPMSDAMPWLTWKQSAANLSMQILRVKEK
jgi:glycosyltransferase involved in cell wall biosynthesis